MNSFFEETTTLTNHGSEKAYIRNIDVKVYDSSNNEVTLAAPYEYSLTHGDGTPVDSADEIVANGTITYKLKFNYITGTDMNTVTDYPTYTFKITYNFTKDLVVLPTGKTKDTLQVGDEIYIKGECFNFLHYEGTNDEDIVMLAKYNLKVGKICDASGTETGEYTSSDLGYGKQSSEVRGWVSGEIRYGTAAFSTTNYWYGGGGLKSEYGTSSTASVYDPINYAGAPVPDANGSPTNPNYSIAYYVEAYKTILTGYGTTIKDARLLTVTEATDSSIGCDRNNFNCPTNGFITNTSFWLGSTKNSAGYYDFMYHIDSNGEFTSGSYYSSSYYGVRPVIVLSKSNI